MVALTVIVGQVGVRRSAERVFTEEDHPLVAFGPDFHRGEVDRRQHVPMRFQERAPRQAPSAVGRRLEAMFPQHVPHRRVGDPIADVGQRALNSIIAPSGILLGEAQD